MTETTDSRLVSKNPNTGTHNLAYYVDVAESTWEKARGLMFRRSMRDDEALIFDFETAASRSVHSFGVRFPIDVIWLEDESVRQVETLPSWTGLSSGRADAIVELAAGQADPVEVGDTIRVREVIE